MGDYSGNSCAKAKRVDTNLITPTGTQTITASHCHLERKIRWNSWDTLGRYILIMGVSIVQSLTLLKSSEKDVKTKKLGLFYFKGRDSRKRADLLLSMIVY